MIFEYFRLFRLQGVPMNYCYSRIGGQMKKKSEPYQCLGDKVIEYKFFDELCIFISAMHNQILISIKWPLFRQTGKIGTGKNTKTFFSYWAWSTPWGHVLSLKSFCQIHVLSWDIRYKCQILFRLLLYHIVASTNTSRLVTCLGYTANVLFVVFTDICLRTKSTNKTK